MKKDSVKRQVAWLMATALFLTSGVLSFPGGTPEVLASPQEGAFYVAADGSDANGDGSMEKPFATFEKARDAARESENDHPIVYVREGEYFFEKPLELTQEDSGITFSSYPGETVTLSGAMNLGELEWTDYEENPSIKVAQLEKDLGVDKIFLDGEEQVLARYPNAVPGKLPLEGAATKEEIKSRVSLYADPAGGYIRAIHSEGWGGNDYIIKGKNSNNELGLEYQWVGDNNRGNNMRDEVVIENVFEELDSQGEWFYDNEDGKLYLWPEDDTDLNEVEVKASVSTDIITIKGEDCEHPVTDITLDGFTYFGTKRTMFTVNEEGKEYIPLLRGDWCVVRAGAIYMENAQNIQVQNSEFLKMGGNGIFMYGYNDGHKIDNNEFIDIGSTAIQVIGNPVAVYEASFWEHALYPDLQVHKTTVDFPDKVGPATEDYPRDVEITNNHIENMGIFEKQSCGINLSVSSRIKILHNTIHKSARSCINVNDGTFGGHEIAYNDIYNAQLETTDHGPFNSWGRDRFWSVPNYNASGQGGEVIRNYEKDGQTYDIALIDAYQTIQIHDNRFQHDSDAAFTWGIDLDDGSSNYEIYNNLCLGLGIKLREGFNRKVYNNIILDGQLQIHVSYTGARDEIYSNIVANATPYGFASVDEERFKQAEYAVDNNWYFDYGAEISLPEWFYVNKGSNNYDKNALIDVDPEFKNPIANDYTVQNEEGMEKTGFENFPMDQFGKPGCACQAPTYAKTESGSGSTDVLQREEWKGATVTGIDNSIISSTASTGYDGIYFESVPEDSEAYALGFRERDIVKRVNGMALPEKEDFFEELEKVSDGALVILDVHRTNRMQMLSYHKTEDMIDCNDASVKYSTEVSEDVSIQNGWYFDERKNGDQNSTTCAYSDADGTNEAWFEVEFTGTKIEYITRKYSDQGDVELILTNAETGEEVDKQTVSCADSDRLYQQTVYSSPELPNGTYKLRGLKKSGQYLIVDAFRVQKKDDSSLDVRTDPAEITYDNGSIASELRPDENLNIGMTFKNNGKKEINGNIVYLWYDISSGMELLNAEFDAINIKAGQSLSYQGTTKTPAQTENRVLQILALDENDMPIAYSTWIKPEGIVLPEAEINRYTPEGEFSLVYDKDSRMISITAAGVKENAQTVLKVESDGRLLYLEQKKAEDDRAGFAFILSRSVAGTVYMTITAASEDGIVLQKQWELDTDAEMVNTTKLEQMIWEARQLEKDDYKEESWNAFWKALEDAENALHSEGLTQEEADQYAAELSAAMENLEKYPLPEVQDGFYAISGEKGFLTAQGVKNHALVTVEPYDDSLVTGALWKEEELENGRIGLQSVQYPSKCVDLNDRSGRENSLVQVWSGDPWGGDHRQFRLIADGDYYRIQTILGEVGDGSWSGEDKVFADLDGTVVYQTAVPENDHQLWKRIETENGIVYENKGSGRLLYLSQDADGAVITTVSREYLAREEQIWKIEYLTAQHGYKITSVASGRVLTAGANGLEQAVYTADESQIWQITQEGLVSSSGCQADGFSVKESREIQVRHLPDSLTILEPETGVSVGTQIQLQAICLPEDAYDASVKWTVTSGTGSAKISQDGMLLGQAPGTVTVTVASVADEGITDSITLTVEGEGIRIYADADTGVQTWGGTDGERKNNYGGSKYIRLISDTSGNHGMYGEDDAEPEYGDDIKMGLLKFPVGYLKNKEVKSAVLKLTYFGKITGNKEGEDSLVVMPTETSDWEEGSGDYNGNRDGGVTWDTRPGFGEKQLQAFSEPFALGDIYDMYENQINGTEVTIDVTELLEALPEDEEFLSLGLFETVGADIAFVSKEGARLIGDLSLQPTLMIEAEETSDQEAADQVERLIEAIGDVKYTQESREKIQAAREAYDKLTQEQKSLVDNYEKLVKAEEIYGNLEEAEKVKELIEAIGDVKYTQESAEKIQAAREAYNKLTQEQKALVENYAVLMQAEETYGKLQASEEVKELINAIGEVAYTQESAEKIQAAREAYNKLTQEQKALVDNYGVLAQAEETYGDLKAADEVKTLIEAIGDVTYTKESAARIEAAKKAYEKLTQEQKAFVDNAGLLSSAEAAYEKLEAEHLKAEEERRKAEEARKEAERIAAEQEKARQEAERAAAEKARQEAAKKAEEEAKQREIRNTKVKRASIKSAKRIKKNRAKITWKKLKGASGYELQYSTRKNFKKATKKKIGKNKTSYTLKKLKKNKKYYVRIRAYKTVHGVKVYGRYSKVKRLG